MVSFRLMVAADCRDLDRREDRGHASPGALRVERGLEWYHRECGPSGFV